MDEIRENKAAETTLETIEATGAPDVPYIVYESAQARAERTTVKLIGVIILLVVLLAGTNAFWLYEWMSYDYVGETTTITQDTQSDGDNNYIGNDGDIFNGTTDNNNKENIENETEK